VLKLSDPETTITVAAYSCDWRLPMSTVLPLIKSIYGIVHEALLNITKHANAKDATVDIHCSPEMLRLRIVDNGVGIRSTKPGLGMLNMRALARSIEANIEFHQAPNGGTIVNISVPFEKKAQAGSA